MSKVALLLMVLTQPLFDGKTLTNWTETQFGGEGGITVDKRGIVLHRGDPLTGVTWAGDPLPKTDYELSLEAMKVDGGDFFCGLTFPVGEASLSLILGGWGGTVVGLSSLDGQDASENETSQNMNFAKNRWYKVRVRVTAKKVEAWIDDKPIIDVATAGRRLSIRPEVDLSRPLGISAYRTVAALRDIKLRRL
jgi:hypothetical protein